jgi:GH24 family phage-related lysozyme (muramidase)
MPRTATATASSDQTSQTSQASQTSIDDLLPAVPRAARAATDARVLCAEVLRWEGFREEMYVGWRGDIRTGIGHLLPSAIAALALPWRHKTTGQPATAAEVRTAYEQVRAQARGHRAPAHQRASDLVLPAGYAAVLATRRLERELLPALRRLCPRFDDFPLPARRALVDMAFNLGARAMRRFHNLIAACNRRDFAAAAEHCLRRGCGVARNIATRDLFRKASRPATA